MAVLTFTIGQAFRPRNLTLMQYPIHCCRCSALQLSAVASVAVRGLLLGGCQGTGVAAACTAQEGQSCIGNAQGSTTSRGPGCKPTAVRNTQYGTSERWQRAADTEAEAEAEAV